MPQFLEKFYNELTCEGGVKTALGLVWSFILASTGYPETAFSSLSLLLLVDFVLGFTRALRERNLRRDKLRMGAYKIVTYWVAIAIITLTDHTLTKALPIETPLANLLIAYLGVNEALSCLEHLCALGLPLPGPLVEWLMRYRDILTDRGKGGPHE